MLFLSLKTLIFWILQSTFIGTSNIHTHTQTQTRPTVCNDIPSITELCDSFRIRKKKTLECFVCFEQSTKKSSESKHTKKHVKSEEKHVDEKHNSEQAKVRAEATHVELYIMINRMEDGLRFLKTIGHALKKMAMICHFDTNTSSNTDKVPKRWSAPFLKVKNFLCHRSYISTESYSSNEWYYTKELNNNFREKKKTFCHRISSLSSSWW